MDDNIAQCIPRRKVGFRGRKFLAPGFSFLRRLLLLLTLLVFLVLDVHGLGRSWYGTVLKRCLRQRDGRLERVGFFPALSEGHHRRWRDGVCHTVE